MFGLSLTKLVFTAAVIAIVWYGWKWLARVRLRVDATAAEKLRRARQEASRPPPAINAEDMVACPTCGDYVPARNPTHCGRDDCPYPG